MFEKRRWHHWLAGVLFAVAMLAGIRLWPHPALADWKPTSTAVYDDHGRLLRLTLAKDDRYRLWTPLERVSPQLVDAVLLHEDRWFRWHPGFSPYGLLRGAWVTYVGGGHPQGGSTITMQLARSLWRINTRTPWGKVRQVARALQLELCYSKRQILEAYLNDVPYGRNVEGAAAASLIYFDKTAERLTLPEALTLAVIPQDPARRVRAGHTQIAPPLMSARNRLYERWLSRHPGDAAQRALFTLPLSLRPLSSLPFEAPHAVDQALAERSAWSIGDDGDAARLDTTVDLDMQHTVERQIGRYVLRFGSHGVRNAAAILVDTRDMSVKALAGSANFADRSIHGQVNGTSALRSPGSTLKPFIYALGFDQGVLHAQTVLRDVPTSFGPYAPENFDGGFLGPITASDALNRSRNVPAVWIAAQLKDPDLYEFLQSAGVRRMASAQHYGLSLVLGGGEVTMQDLASLYAALANGGLHEPLRLRTTRPRAMPKRLLSEQASFMTMDILRQHPRPDDTSGAASSGVPVYWKTGTSWSFRDAWTAGIFGPYVLVVWVGNFDNSSNAAFIGVDAAAPLFFQVVDAMQAEFPIAKAERRAPANLKRVRVCLASGDLPNEWCPQQGWTWFIPGKSSIRVSTVHRRIVIDDATGQPACPPYADKRTHTEVYEFWPSDLQKVFASAGMPRRSVPSNPACRDSGLMLDDAPKMLSPSRATTYALRLHHGESGRIAFTATAAASVHTLYWFVDDAFIGSAAARETLFWQPSVAGEYTVRVVDDQGRSDARPLRVALTE